MKEEHKFLQTTRFSFEISKFFTLNILQKARDQKKWRWREEMKERMINFFFEEKFNFVTIEVECANCISKDFSFWLKNILGSIR